MKTERKSHRNKDSDLDKAKYYRRIRFLARACESKVLGNKRGDSTQHNMGVTTSLD